MSKLLNHFIITRFNLRQSIWLTDKHGIDVNSIEWLENRYKLFETYCFPSIANQTVLEFKWLVYFDSQLPEVFKEKNKNLNQQFPNFIPVYVTSFSDFENELPNHISTYSEQTRKFLLTTRLDNDDGFHKDAIKIIQFHFKPIHKAIIDLKNGLALQITDENKLSLKSNTTSGPFITLIEEVLVGRNILTVYDREHLKWVNDATFINVEKGYYWLQIIHERNVSNTLDGQLSFNKKYLKGFDFLNNITFSLRYRIFIILKKIGLLKYLRK